MISHYITLLYINTLHSRLIIPALWLFGLPPADAAVDPLARVLNEINHSFRRVLSGHRHLHRTI